jgi:DegV family protein with EDD domain
MSSIQIVTDSTADVSREQAEKYGIRVVPLTVSFGDKLYTDGVDITPMQFYEKLATEIEMPKTSQPSPEAFRLAYNEIAGQGDTILSIHVSGRLSGTLNSAKTAAEQAIAKVITIDTLNASQGVGRSVLIAAEALKRGMPLEEVLAITNLSIANTFSVFAVDTLEFLQRNGRIGKAASLLGSLLQLKPILYADEEGMVGVYDKVRGRSKVVRCLVEAALKKVSPESPVNLSVVHVNAEERANLLLDALKEHYVIADLHLGPVGPGIGSHIGPGAISLMIQPSFETLQSML